MEPPSEWQRAQRERAHDVGADHQRFARVTVGEHAGDGSEQGNDRELEGLERPDGERTGAERDDRDGGKGEGGQLAAEIRHELSAPEQTEIAPGSNILEHWDHCPTMVRYRTTSFVAVSRNCLINC